MAIWQRVARGRDGGCCGGVCRRRGICMGRDEDAEAEDKEFVKVAR